MRKFSVFAIVALALWVVGVSAASAGGFYVGGSVGQTSADVDGAFSGPGVSTDDSDSGFKVMGGYNIMKFIAVEAAFVDVGQVSATAPGASATAEADGFSVEALGIFPFANKFEVFAKAGFYLWDGEAAISGVGNVGDDGTDATYGVGFGWNAFNHGQVRVEAERYTLDFVGDVDMYSAGFNWRF